MRVLVVEDNARLADFLAVRLRRAGMAVDVLATAKEGRAAVSSNHYDAMILDLGLPDGDGMEVLHAGRRRGVQVPVLVLTARDGLKDRVDGLNAGADDYLAKPFEPEELIARVKALMRRPGGVLGVTLTIGNLAFDSVAREVRVGDDVVSISRREIDLLEHLLRRPGRVVPKQRLEETVYGFGEEVSSNSIEVAVHRLRRTLEVAGATARIHTLRGIGYMIQG